MKLGECRTLCPEAGTNKRHSDQLLGSSESSQGIWPKRRKSSSKTRNPNGPRLTHLFNIAKNIHRLLQGQNHWKPAEQLGGGFICYPRILFILVLDFYFYFYFPSNWLNSWLIRNNNEKNISFSEIVVQQQWHRQSLRCYKCYYCWLIYPTLSY